MLFRKSKKQASKKFKIIFIIVLGLCLIGINAWKFFWSTAIVELDGQPLHVLVAKNNYHLKKGLGGRETLGDYDGMVFLFPKELRQGILMRNMHFPIDIIWIDVFGKVVDIAPSVQVEPNVEEEDLTVYYPRKEAKFILELAAGWAEEQDLKIGDKFTVIDE